MAPVVPIRPAGITPIRPTDSTRTPKTVMEVLKPILFVARLLGLLPVCLDGDEDVRVKVPWIFYSVLALGVLLSYQILALALLTSNFTVPGTSVSVAATIITKCIAVLVMHITTLTKCSTMAKALQQLSRSERKAGPLESSGRKMHFVVLLQISIPFMVLVPYAYDALQSEEYKAFIVDVGNMPTMHFVDVLFINMVLVLRAQLQALNSKLAELFGMSMSRDSYADADPGATQAWTQTVGSVSRLKYRGMEVPVVKLADPGFVIAERVRMLRVLQRELRASYQLLNTAFGLQILMSLMAAFLDTTVVLYSAWDNPYDSISELFWVAYVISLLCGILWASQGTKEYSTRTAEVVHRAMLHDNLPQEVRTELREFSLQLLTAEMRFSAWGFFILDFGLLQSFAGTVTTYLVIMVQFKNATNNPVKPGNGTNTTTTTTTTTTTRAPV